MRQRRTIQNSKLKTQNSQFNMRQRRTIQNSKFKTQNSWRFELDLDMMSINL